MQSGGYPPQGGQQGGQQGGYNPQAPQGGGYGAPIPPAQGGPGGYGGGPGYGGPQRPPVNATMPLVFGILSLLCCGIFGPIALVQGNGVMKDINAGGGTDSDRTMVTIGRVLGIIGCVRLAFEILYIAILLAAAVIGAKNPSKNTMNTTTPPSSQQQSGQPPSDQQQPSSDQQQPPADQSGQQPPSDQQPASNSTF